MLEEKLTLEETERRQFIENTLDLWSRDPTMTISKLIGALYDDCRVAMRASERRVLDRCNDDGGVCRAHGERIGVFHIRAGDGSSA
jgi:hypothetical protein